MMFRKTTLALAVTSALGLASAALAEENQNAVQLDAQTVIGETAAAEKDSYQAKPSSAATKLELSQRETPQSVSTITRAQLDDFKLTSVNDALKYTTGIGVEEVETDRTYFTARGFDITNFQYDGIGTPFVYGNLDGSIDTAPFERIEVLRGANGLMSGTGNPSATINFVRKRPTLEPQARIDLTAGSWDLRRIDTDVSGALSDAGNVRGRLVYAHENKNSYLDRYSREKNIFYGVVEVDLSDDTLFSLGHTLQKTAADSPMWGALPLTYTDGSRTRFSRSASTASDWSYWDNQEQRTFAELSHSFANGWQAKGTLTHVKKRGDAKLFYVYGTPDHNGQGLGRFPSLYDDENTQWIADLYLKGPFELAGRQHELVLGGYWSKSELEDISHYGHAIPPGISLEDVLSGNAAEPSFDASIAGSTFDDRQKSLYSAARFSLADPLTLIVGARAIDHDSEGGSYGSSRSRSDRDLTPYAGLIYDLNERFSLYASYTEIFDPQAKTDRNDKRLEPLQGKSYEAGIKGELLDGKLNVTVATFRTKQQNVPESDSVPGKQAFLPADYLSEGYELEVSGELLPGLQALAGYTYVDIQDAEHDRGRPFAPKHMVRSALTYRIPQFERLKLGTSINWQDDISRGQAKQSSYALVNLAATYELDDNWSVSANLNNLTDEKYLTSLYWAQAYYGAPRNASMSLSWKY